MALNTLLASIAQQEYLYDRFVDGSQVLYNDETMTWNHFNSGADMIQVLEGGGLKTVWSVTTGRSPAVGSAGDGDPLPKGQKTPADQASENVTYTYGGMLMSANDMFASRDPGNGAFLETVTQTVRACVDGMRKEMNWKSWATTAGGLAQLSSGQSITTAGVATAVDNPATRLVDLLVGATGKQFAIGNPGTNGTGVMKGKVELTASPTSETSLTLKSLETSAVAGANNDWVLPYNTKQGTATTPLKSEAFDPIPVLIGDSGTVHGINSSTVPTWKSYVSSAITLAENVFNTPVHEIRRRCGRPRRLMCVGSPEAITDYQEVFYKDKRYLTSTAIGGLDVSAVQVGTTTVGFWDDIDCPSGSGSDVYLLDWEYMGSLQGGGLEWVREPDSMQYWRQAINSDGRPLDQYEAQLRIRHAILAIKRNAHAKLVSFRP